MLYLSEKPIFAASISQLKLAYFVFCTEIAPKPQMREKDRLSSHIFDSFHYSKTEEINQSAVQNIVYLLHSFPLIEFESAVQYFRFIIVREDTRCPAPPVCCDQIYRDSWAG